MNFLEENSQILQEDELSALLDVLMGKNLVYWLMYPNFFNILSRLISILAHSSNPVLSQNMSALLFKIIHILNNNVDISEEERNDLFIELEECLKAVGNRKIFLDKDKLRRAIEKIKEQQTKESILKLLDSIEVTV